jgi:hypothetical protein
MISKGNPNEYKTKIVITKAITKKENIIIFLTV